MPACRPSVAVLIFIWHHSRMRIPRIYHPHPLTDHAELLLSASASQHILRVLRLKNGASLCLFDGKGNQAHAKLLGEKKRIALVKLGAVEQNGQHESPLSIHLGLALIRSERMDYAIQKAVELGVTAITPLMTQRSIIKLPPARMDKRLQHWQAIAVSACAQCGRNVVPPVHRPVELTHWHVWPDSKPLAGAHETLTVMLQVGAEAAWTDLPQSCQKVNLCIGPEGGWDEAESHFLKEKALSVRPVRLGPRILRAETAAIAAVTAAQIRWGDLDF